MATPPSVGKVHYNEPRAVQVRDPEDNLAPHSAIHCGIHVFTDNKNETEFLMKMWSYLMADMNNTIEEMLNSDPESPRNKEK